MNRMLRHVALAVLIIVIQVPSIIFAGDASLGVLPTENIAIVTDDFKRLYEGMISSGGLDFNNRLKTAVLIKEKSIIAFEDNGYSYGKTLKKIATDGFEFRSKEEYAENARLVLKLISIFSMPGNFLEDTNKIDAIYSKQEQEYISILMSRVDNDISFFISE